jgi:trimethylamine--corrinoid protein Co-methyltransferase
MQKGLSGGQYRPLTDEAIQKIHRTVMKVMEEVGFEANAESALDCFESAGASVDRSQRRVRIPEKLAMELIARAPSDVRLCGKDEKNDLLLGGTRVHAGSGGTALYVYEPDKNERRSATLEDVRNIARLVEHLDNIHLFMLPTYPSELPVEQVDVNRFFAALDSSTKHIMGGVYTPEGVQHVIRMAEIIAGSPEALKERPLISMITCSISPMKLDAHYGDLVVDIAKKGVPLVVPSEPLCGATSPVTLAGNVVIQVVDSLMGVMLTQIVNPGTPVIFGSVATSTNLNNLNYLAGSIEMGLINAAAAQMAQFYKLPFYATGGMTDSKALDAQSGYESALTSLLCALSGSNFIHDAAGLMEFALTVCYEKYVIDNEILGMVMRAVQGIRVDDDTLAYELIKQIGPGGNFVTAKHTRHNMRAEHYQPQLSDRDSREEWEEKGGKMTWQRASEVVKETIASSDYRLPEEVRKRVIAEIPDIVK